MGVNKNNTAYIIMDFLDGITLKTWLEQNGKMQTGRILDNDSIHNYGDFNILPHFVILRDQKKQAGESSNKIGVENAYHGLGRR